MTSVQADKQQSKIITRRCFINYKPESRHQTNFDWLTSVVAYTTNQNVALHLAYQCNICTAVYTTRLPRQLIILLHY